MQIMNTLIDGRNPAVPFLGAQELFETLINGRARPPAGLVALCLLTGCASPVENPREELERRGIELNAAAFYALLDANDAEAVARLLDAGLSPPRRALRRASRAGHCQVVQALLESRYDATGILGTEALMWASVGEHHECSQLLRADGADLLARDASGENLLTRAAVGGDAGLLGIIVSAGADPNAPNRNGESALIVASRAGKAERVKQLLSLGADIDAGDPDGWTALMFAVRARRDDMVQRLVDGGAAVNASSRTGWTPLMMAARHGQLDTVEILLSADADPNLTSQAGLSPLIRAAQSGHAGVVKALLEGGAERTLRLDGVDALWWALALGHRPVVALLDDDGSAGLASSDSAEQH